MEATMYRSHLYTLLSAFVFTLGVATSVDAHAPGVVLTGFGTPTIDGVLNSGEWDNAGSINFPVNIPPSQGGGTVQGTLFVMNDATNLYLAVEFPFTASGNTASFQFDNDHGGGSLVNGDDAILRNTSTFSDLVRTSDPPCIVGLCGLLDTTLGGTNDGAGAFSNAGGVTVYEFSHPLDSADDPYDFSLSTGDTVGVGLFIWLLVPPSSFPNDFGDTGFPSTLSPNAFGDILVTLEVAIDIKPGSDPNTVNPKSKGVIPVAVLGSVNFDATQVDFSTVGFGPGEASPVHDGHVENVNGDGFADIVFHFKVRDAGIVCGVTNATLTGETFGGNSITGTNAVKTAGCE
jgi:hypothetical protein